MRYTHDDIAKLQGDVKTAILHWGYKQIDKMTSGKPMLMAGAPFLKNGYRNYLQKSCDKINSYIDMAMLFLTDEHGNIDTGKSFDQLLTMLINMDKQHLDVWGVGIDIGGGEICITMPDNAILDLFGFGKIKLDARDIGELKSLLP